MYQKTSNKKPDSKQRLLAIPVAFVIACQSIGANGEVYPACPSGYTTQALLNVFERAAFSESNSITFRKEMPPVGFSSTRALNVSASDPYFANARDAAVYLFLIYPYSFFDSSVVTNSNMSYLGHVVKAGIDAETASYQSGFEHNQLEHLLKEENDAYQCLYQTHTGNGRTGLATIHRVPESGAAEDYKKVWSCVERSFLSFLGYPSPESLSEDELVSGEESAGDYKPTELFGWLVRVALSKEFGLPANVREQDAIAKLEDQLQKRCE